MFKRNIIGILFATFMITSNINTEYGLEYGMVKQYDYLNIRKCHSVNYKVVSKLYTNDIIDITDKYGNWYEIKTNSNI